MYSTYFFFQFFVKAKNCYYFTKNIRIAATLPPQKSQGTSPEPVHFHRLGQKSGSGRLHNTALGHYKNSYIQSFSPSPCFTNIGSSSSIIFYQNESKMKLRVWSRSDQIPYTATGINQNTSKFSHKKIKVKEVGSSISKKRLYRYSRRTWKTKVYCLKRTCITKSRKNI